MERIVLEVDDTVAKAWRNTSAKLRAQIGQSLGQALTDSLNKNKELNFELLLQDVRAEAAKYGLTEQILARLLDEEN
ncbi:MAG: hypothetical protein H7289_11060 [Mucilaginibacter sp.]|nr:hypothetical protein [Mucilaginibacter sp.]